MTPKFYLREAHMAVQTELHETFTHCWARY